MSPKVVFRCRKLSTTTLTTNDNISSLLNNGCPKLSSVVVKIKHDNIDNQ